MARFLDLHSGSVLPWRPTAETYLFRKILSEALADSKSLVRRRLTATRSKDIGELRRAISGAEKLGRTQCLEFAKRTIPHRVRAFMREVNLAYYSIGAFDMSLELALHPRYFDDLRDVFQRRPGLGSVYDHVDMLGSFEYLMSELSFPKDLLNKISIKSIVDIRDRYPGDVARFRKKWWSLLDTAGSRSMSRESAPQTISDEFLDSSLTAKTRVSPRF